MLSLRRVAMVLVALAGSAWGQPSLTTISDILYTANGRRFTGTVVISWNSFLAGNGSNIPSSVITRPVVNGVLKVQLVPTTNASAGAQYTVTYNSGGRSQFTEVWAIPPNNLALRVRDVRIATGTVVGPEPVTSPVQISDVVGLVNELAVRPMKGVSYLSDAQPSSIRRGRSTQRRGTWAIAYGSTGVQDPAGVGAVWFRSSPMARPQPA